ncbi:MAG: quinol:cytochrome C oxidoreductase [Chitinophagaceae bacterium]
MKQFLILVAIILTASVTMISCGGAHGNDPGDAYMPDMYYSRAYETYGYNDVGGEYDTLKARGIFYNGYPVAGTMARGDVDPYPYQNTDTGYAQSAAFKNPNDSVTLSPAQMKEAERLYLVNCGICHGTNLDGNGPLWKGGEGPYPAAPRNLKDDYSKKLADGTIYHVIEYGKGQMGSYASQVRPEQRWWIIKYIRSKQGSGAPASTADTTKASATGAKAPTANNPSGNGTMQTKK